jgi:3-dehydroquinate synthase
MVCAARLSERVCGLSAADTSRIRDLVNAAKLPTAPPRITGERWLELMQRDKKVHSGALRFVLLDSLGHALVRGDVAEADAVQSIG